MAFPLLVPLISAGISGVGSLLSNRESARTSKPVIAPEFKTLADLLRTRAEERLRSSADMSGFQASGAQNINDVAGGIKQAVENNLTTRGLASSPVAATVGTNLELGRGANIAQFLNSLPLLQRQMQNQDMAAAADALRFGTGNVAPGSAVGAGLDDASGWLGYLWRQRQLGGTPPFVPGG